MKILWIQPFMFYMLMHLNINVLYFQILAITKASYSIYFAGICLYIFLVCIILLLPSHLQTIWVKDWKQKSHRWRSLIPAEIFLRNINAFLSCFDCVSSRDSGWNKSELWRIIQFAEIRCLHSALSPPLSDNETLETNYNQIQITHFILQQTCQ